MKPAEALRRFEMLAGECLIAVAVGPSRHWSNLDPPETVEPLPRDWALAQLDRELPTGTAPSVSFHPIVGWTASWVLFLAGRDADAGLAWLPRDPRRCAPSYFGAWEPDYDGSGVRPTTPRAVGGRGLSDDDRRTIAENGPTPDEPATDRWHDRPELREEPGGVVRPAVPVAAARLVARVARGDIDERQAADEATRSVIADPGSDPNERMVAWSIRRKLRLDGEAERRLTRDQCLIQWGEGRIGYREVMWRVGAVTIDDLLEVVLAAGLPFGPARDEAVLAFSRRVATLAETDPDRLAALMVFARHRLGVADFTVIYDEELIRGIDDLRQAGNGEKSDSE